jgi:hypothetical protein
MNFYFRFPWVPDSEPDGYEVPYSKPDGYEVPDSQPQRYVFAGWHWVSASVVYGTVINLSSWYWSCNGIYLVQITHLSSGLKSWWGHNNNVCQTRFQSLIFSTRHKTRIGRASTRCYAFHNSEPCLPVREGSGATTHPTDPDLLPIRKDSDAIMHLTASDPTSLLDRASILSSHDSGPRFPAQEGSNVVTHPTTLYRSWIKKCWAATGVHQVSCVTEVRLCITKVTARRTNTQRYHDLHNLQLQYCATVHHHMTDRSWTWFAEAMTQ